MGDSAVEGPMPSAILKLEPGLMLIPETAKTTDRAGRIRNRPTGFQTAAIVGGPRLKEQVKFRIEDQQTDPILLGYDLFRSRYYWIFQQRLYSSMEPLEPGEVKALTQEAENKVKARIARSVALMEKVSQIETGREPIPDDVKVFVWQRDRGCCVRCGSRQNLEFDHIIPVVMGGSNTARNLQLLCQPCNREKGGSLA
jgi:hypothetical protein